MTSHRPSSRISRLSRLSRLCGLARLACLAACTVAAGAARADITFYDSRAAFLSAVGNPAVDSFDSLPTATLLGSPLARTAGGYDYAASVDGGFFAVGTADDVWLSSNDALPIGFGAFAVDLRGVGGFFFATDLEGVPLAGESITFTATDDAGAATRTLLAPSQTTFFGFVSTGAIVGLQVGVVDTGSNNAWVTVNDLTLAQAAAPVPEPATPGLLLAGLAAVAAAASRRQRR